jgi:hypothetical protein
VGLGGAWVGLVGGAGGWVGGWGRKGSNLRPRDYESPALTTELRPLDVAQARRATRQSVGQSRTRTRGRAEADHEQRRDGFRRDLGGTQLQHTWPGQ